MQVQSRNNFTFGQSLTQVQFENLPRGVNPRKEMEKSQMIIDGQRVRYGDEFFILDEKGEFKKTIFNGAFIDDTNVDESKRNLVKIDFGYEKKQQVPVKNSLLHVFTEDGLKPLFRQIKEHIPR